jgi:predicted outer membrane repeat protein
MYISNTDAEVTISRVWFKDGRATSNSAALRIEGRTVTLESCIFSGNRTSDTYANGGAIYKVGSGTLNVKGCTFYDNRAGYYGGAIYLGAGTLTLAGNLFYGNTANSGPVVYRGGGTVTSNGYNVTDVSSSGYTRTIGDKTISELPVLPENLKLVSGEANVITNIPANYPAKDFYGTDIKTVAAAGAEQESAATG